MNQLLAHLQPNAQGASVSCLTCISMWEGLDLWVIHLVFFDIAISLVSFLPFDFLYPSSVLMNTD